MAVEDKGELQVEDSLPARSRAITQKLMIDFTEKVGFRNPIHYGGDFAARSAYGGPIASGPLLLCLLDDMMISQFGDDWFASGALSVAFIGPVRPEDRVTVNATVSSAEYDSNAQRYEFEITCTTQAGAAVMAGTASVSVPFGNGLDMDGGELARA